MTLRLTTLGTPNVLLGEEELTSLPGKPVTFGLLVYLALEKEATRDRLVSVFWPESSPEKARHTLSQTLYELRQTLGEEWIESTGNSVQVSTSMWVDCSEFVKMAEDGRDAEAIALYGGPFLEGVYLAQTHPFEEWVDRHRARFGRRFRASADSLIRRCQTEGDCEAALKTAWKWVGFDPLDDGAQQHLIQLLAETGSRTEALAQYERYKAMLEKELGLDPLEETVAMVEAIKRGELLPGTGSGSVIPSPGPAPVLKESSALDVTELQRSMNDELSPWMEILRPIGEGSMSVVFLARQPTLRRLVAVKVLSPRHYSDSKARKRFEREARAAAQIEHPNVCTVHDVAVLKDGTPFLWTPFVKGTTLAQRLKAEGRLNPPEVQRVLREVASALAAAHKLGFVHRDVRPANVLRADESGQHKLCDFGIAGVLETGDPSEVKLTATGEILGDPSYISPEQLEGDPLTDRADIYSLGVLGYELLTGKTPRGGVEADQARYGKGAAVDLTAFAAFMRDQDRPLMDLITRCLAKDPTHRPSAADVQRKLSEERRASLGENFNQLTEVNLGKLLFRKRLPQFLGAYVAGGWIAVEAAGMFQNRGLVPEWLFWLTAVSVVFGFFAVSVVGWFHGEKGRQKMPAVEKWLLGVLALGWVVSCSWVVITL